MRVLVLGGTRFTGRIVVERLLAAGNQVHVVSRRGDGCPPGAIPVIDERQGGLARLSGKHFDLTLDFICSGSSDVDNVFETVSPGCYVLISTVWVPRITEHETPLLDLTQRYLAAKLEAEEVVQRRRQGGASATILRLPMMWGETDHSGRYDFYRWRLKEGRPVIAVDGGANKAQVAWSEDIADVMIAWIEAAAMDSRLLWEALPNSGTTVRDIITAIAVANSTNAQFIDIGSAYLVRTFGVYLDEEPLWRERPELLGEGNLFAVTKRQATPHAKWFKKIAGQASGDVDVQLAAAESTFLAKHGYA